VKWVPKISYIKKPANGTKKAKEDYAYDKAVLR
jgi:hypothetical protein